MMEPTFPGTVVIADAPGRKEPDLFVRVNQRWVLDANCFASYEWEELFNVTIERTGYRG